MSSFVVKRLAEEVKDLKNNPVENCSAGPIDDNLLLWNATIFGPEKTPYHGGIFKLEINFNDKYPFKPPTIIFKTPIYHCNISKQGSICLDILKDQWSPALTISKVLLSICSLLAEPNPSDPLEPEIAKLLVENREMHDGQALEYTLQYANGDEVNDYIVDEVDDDEDEDEEGEIEEDNIEEGSVEDNVVEEGEIEEVDVNT